MADTDYKALAEALTSKQSQNFLIRMAATVRQRTLSNAPRGPWQVSPNAALQDCISVPHPQGDGLLQIGKGIHPTALRTIMAADPANIENILTMMDALAEEDNPNPALLRPMVELALRWNTSMTLGLDEPTPAGAAPSEEDSIEAAAEDNEDAEVTDQAEDPSPAPDAEKPADDEVSDETPTPPAARPRHAKPVDRDEAAADSEDSEYSKVW